MKKNNSKENNKIRFENEEEGPIQIVLNKKGKVMEEKPLVEGVGEDEGEDKEKSVDVKEEDKEKSVEEKEEENKDKPSTTPTTISPTYHTTTSPTHHTTTPTPTTEQITPLEKATAFATAIVKAITDGLIKVFVWITELFKRRRREGNEGEIGEEMREEIKEGVKEEKV